MQTILLALALPLALASPEQVHLSFQGDYSVMGVSWITFKKDDSDVLYGTALNNLEYTAKGTKREWSTGKITRYAHRALMQNLRPLTTYWYKVETRTFQFKTLPENPTSYRVCIFGDLGQKHGNSTMSILRNGMAGMFDSFTIDSILRRVEYHDARMRKDRYRASANQLWKAVDHGLLCLISPSKDNFESQASDALRFCKIDRARDIYSNGDCTHLELYATDGISNEPGLYNSIKIASTYYKFYLSGSLLKEISNMSTVKLVKDAEFVVTENFLLERLPRFEIENGRRILLNVHDNPLLDTTQLLEECKKKRCPPRIINSIQMPYSCSYLTSQTLTTCTNVTDDIDVKEQDLNATVEVLYGTLMLRRSNWTSFPKMKNLRQVVQRPGKAVLIIEDNQNLRDLDALFDIDFSIRDFETAVKIKNNPELCLHRNHSNNSFAQEFLTTLRPCSLGCITNPPSLLVMWVVTRIITV